MSWIKNVFNKLIGDEPENKEQINNVHKDIDENEEVDEFYEQEPMELPTEQIEQQATEKKDFKFPMYQDEDSVKREKLPLVENQPVLEVENTDERPLVLRKAVEPQMQKNHYSPFASQQQVGRPVVDAGRESYKPFANSGGAPKKPKFVELPKAPKKKIPSFEERKRDVKETIQTIQPVEAPPKKKFVPTDVPSPVFGFNKRVEKTAYERKVNELLVEERNRHKGTIADQLVKQRLEKENRLFTSKQEETSYENEKQSTVQENAPVEPVFERKTIIPKDIKPADIEVEKFSFGLSDVVTEIEVPEPSVKTTEIAEPEVIAEAVEVEEVVAEVVEQEEVIAEAVEQEEVITEAVEAEEVVAEAVEVEEVIAEVVEAEEVIAEVVEQEEVVAEVVEAEEVIAEAVEAEEVVAEAVEVEEVITEVAEPEVITEAVEAEEVIAEAVEAEEVVAEVVEQEKVIAEAIDAEEINEPVLETHTVIDEAEAIIGAAVEAKQVNEDLVASAVEGHQATPTEEVSSLDVDVSEEISVTAPRVSKTPINVVMLKSDKAKLKEHGDTNEQPLKITFPEWKKNPLKVMQSYGQINQLSEKATVHKAVEEVHPTGGNSQQVVEVHTSVAVMEPQIEDFQLDEGNQSQVEVVDAVVAVPTTDSTNILVEKEEVQQVVEEEFIHQKIEVTEETRPAAWSSYKQSLALLREPVEEQQDYEWMESQGELLKEVLAEFNIPAEIVQIFQGPTVTQFEITVGHGVKISKIRNLSDNFKLALAAREIRIEAPIPGKRTIGIEIPNATARPVRLSEIVGDHAFEQSTNQLEVALGLDLTGQPVTFNLNDMPHGLIAGSTGSGKSVCINSILMSLIMKASPRDVKLMLIDPKMVELAVYDELPHLVSPVITDVKAATAALKWAVEEMERRYQLFHHMKVRHISRYNEIVEEQRRFSLKMPYLVIVIDELADLMMMAPSEVEESICRIAQKARACGIHLVLATQRPSVDVITGLIKSNIPTRIAFAVSSQIDSRTILDSQGAERLLGKGDMLYLGSGKSAASRLQGTFVTDEEIEDVTSYIRTLGKPDYSFAPEELVHKVEREEEQDDLFEEACRHVAEEGSVSISALQRKYRIGYNRAARLVEMMDTQGFVSEARGTKPRDVFITPEKVEEIFS